jgi:hypothetical protein
VLEDKYNSLREEEDTRAFLGRSVAEHVGDHNLPAEEGFVFADTFAKYDKKITKLKEELAEARADQGARAVSQIHLLQESEHQKLAEMKTDEQVRLEHAKRVAAQAAEEAAFDQKRKDMSKLLSEVRPRSVSSVYFTT